MLGDIINLDREDIDPDVDLTGSEGIAGIDLAHLVVDCEKRFHVSFYDEDLIKFSTIRKMAAYIRELKEDN
jgi:acyl carrier protein